MLSLRERIKLDLEARLMGETLVLNRSLDPFFEDYIELNDLNVPLELGRDHVDDLMPTMKEDEVIEEFRARNDAIAGFDWSDMAEEQVQTNMALMVFLDFKLDLSYSGLDGIQSLNSKFGSKGLSEDTSSFVESSLNVDKETIFLVDKKIEFVKPKNHEKPVKKSVRPKAVITTRPHSVVVNVVRVNQANAVKASACLGKPQQDDIGFIDSRCSRHMTGNIAYLLDFKEFNGGYVTFGGGAHSGRISGKGTLKTDSLDFEDASASQHTITDESMLWHRRLGHINFKNINKLVKDNLVRGLPTKSFENDQTFVACLKGKQHRLLDQTSEILKNFIKEIENLVDKKVKKKSECNGTKFKNKVMDDFCREKGIKREYSVARTPQQNGVAERRNRILIEAARSMLADSKPFGCDVTILNTLDNLGKFDGKRDEGFFVGYSLSSKAFRVYNTRTKRIEENLHIRFLENKPMIEENGPKWLFDIASLTQSMNYVPVAAGTILNESTETQGELNIDGLHNESDETDKSEDDRSPKEVNAAGQHVNTASLEVNTGRFKPNIVDPSVNTASSYELDSPKDMFKFGS
ncbi:Myc-type, basic helix-loop-helix domain-containing protein [Tanacetum coccineum]